MRFAGHARLGRRHVGAARQQSAELGLQAHCRDGRGVIAILHGIGVQRFELVVHGIALELVASAALGAQLGDPDEHLRMVEQLRKSARINITSRKK